VIRQEEVEKASGLRLLPEFVHDWWRSPSVPRNLGFEDGFGGNAFIFDPVPNLLYLFDGLRAKFGPHPRWEVLEGRVVVQLRRSHRNEILGPNEFG